MTLPRPLAANSGAGARRRQRARGEDLRFQHIGSSRKRSEFICLRGDRADKVSINLHCQLNLSLGLFSVAQATPLDKPLC